MCSGNGGASKSVSSWQNWEGRIPSVWEIQPQVPEGLQGWGAKGILDLDLIQKLAQEYAKSWKMQFSACRNPPSFQTAQKKERKKERKKEEEEEDWWSTIQCTMLQTTKLFVRCIQWKWAKSVMFPFVERAKQGSGCMNPTGEIWIKATQVQGLMLFLSEFWWLIEAEEVCHWFFLHGGPNKHIFGSWVGFQSCGATM